MLLKKSDEHAKSLPGGVLTCEGIKDIGPDPEDRGCCHMVVRIPLFFSLCPVDTSWRQIHSLFFEFVCILELSTNP